MANWNFLFKLNGFFAILNIAMWVKTGGLLTLLVGLTNLVACAVSYKLDKS